MMCPAIRYTHTHARTHTGFRFSNDSLFFPLYSKKKLIKKKTGQAGKHIERFMQRFCVFFRYFVVVFVDVIVAAAAVVVVVCCFAIFRIWLVFFFFF